MVRVQWNNFQDAGQLAQRHLLSAPSYFLCNLAMNFYYGSSAFQSFRRSIRKVFTCLLADCTEGVARLENEVDNG